MATICLNMIVKNEAALIRRCLDSVLPHIDSWVIMDTGSSDGTQDLIREHLRALPGELFEGPFTDFGQARTEALARVGDRADYVLFMDADDTLVCPESYALPLLTADAYYLEFVEGADAGISYRRPALVATRLPWRFEGVLHEYLTAGETRGISAQWLDGPTIRGTREGARNADPQKYLKDAAILERALGEDPGNCRYQFYLAQSYRDAGRLEQSLEAYRRRAVMGGWEEEVWYSLFEAARLQESLQRPAEAVVAAYLEAWNARPRRAEPLYHLARLFRLRNEYPLALLFAEKAIAVPRPGDMLFLDESVYRWRALDEFAVAAYWNRREQESAQASRALLDSGHLPADEVARVEANLRAARLRLLAA